MRKIDDMRKREPAGSWLPLYVAFAAVLGLLWLERHASLTAADHSIALLTIVAVFFVMAWIWVGVEDKKRL